MARLKNKHARTKPHRLFEDERHVAPEQTTSLLDEAMWSQAQQQPVIENPGTTDLTEFFRKPNTPNQQLLQKKPVVETKPVTVQQPEQPATADTLNDDDRDSSIEPEKFISRNAPQITDQSDTNPAPDSEETQQSSQQGEQNKGDSDNAGGGIADDFASEPEFGDEYPGRTTLLHNFPSDKNNLPPMSSGSGHRQGQMINKFRIGQHVVDHEGHEWEIVKSEFLANKDEEYVYWVRPIGSQETGFLPHRLESQLRELDQGDQDILLHQAQFTQRVKDFATGQIGFDRFMEMVGNNDSITVEQFNTINKKLQKLLLDNGIIQEPQYKINNDLYTQILRSIKQSGIDPKELADWQLEQAISGALQQKIQQQNQPQQQSQPRQQQPSGGVGMPSGGGTVQPQQPSAPEPAEQPQPAGSTEPLQLAEDVQQQAQGFDLQKIPTVAKMTLAKFGKNLSALTGRSEELVNLVFQQNRSMTVGQFLQLPFDQLPQPPSPGQVAAEDVEKKRGPYTEPLVRAQVENPHIPEETDPDQPGPIPVGGLQEGEGRYPFTEEDLQAAKQIVYDTSVKMEQQIAQDKERKRQQPTQQVHQPTDEPAELEPEPEQNLATQPLVPPAGSAPERTTPDDFADEQQTPAVQRPTTQGPLRVPQKQIITNYLEQLRRQYPESASIPASADAFGSWEEFDNWYKQQRTAVRESIRTAMNELGINMPKIMTIEDVRRVSPKHAQRMEEQDIAWVEHGPFMTMLQKSVVAQAEAAQNPVKLAHSLRRQGKSFNHINVEIISGFMNGHYDARKRDLGHIAVHRLAQKAIDGDFNVTAQQLEQDVAGYVELMAAKSDVTPKNYIKKASKQIRATDYTLYSMKEDADAKDFNYADPLDVEWTLFRQTEGGKKGAKLDVLRHPSCAIMCASDHGDGEYLVRGESLIDEVYWGTYTIKVQNGIVTQYAKIPVDKEGKRLASLSDDNDQKRILARRKYVAMYRAMTKLGMIKIAQPMPGWEDFPQSDEEIDERMKVMQEWYDKRQQTDRNVTDKIRNMSPRMEPVAPGPMPTQEEADAAYEAGLRQMLEEHPEMRGDEGTGISKAG